jgi:hypothetical protein
MADSLHESLQRTLPEHVTLRLTRVATRVIPERVTQNFTRALTRVVPIHIPDQVNPALPDHLLDQITLPDLFPTRLLPTQLYPTTQPDFLTRLGNTSLHLTAYTPYPITLPGRVSFNWPHPKSLPIGLPPCLRLVLADNSTRYLG